MLNLKEFSAFESFDLDVYFNALITIAKADGEMSKTETAFIQDQARLLDYDLSSIIDKQLNLNDLGILEASSFTKKIIIRDCLSLAYVDRNYDIKERENIYKIGGMIGITSQEIDEIDKWLNEYWAIIEKGEQLFIA